MTSKAIAVLALLAGVLFNFNPLNRWNYLVFSENDAGVFLAFINWDGQHYLRLASTGYPIPADPSTAFFPLFPGLIALMMKLGLHPIAAALLLVALFSALALYFLGQLLPADDAAPSSLWLFACFPTAFYLSIAYTEALFLGALLGLLWALRDPQRAGWAIVCAAALPVTRGQGLWLAAPIAAAWLWIAFDRSSANRIDRRSVAAATVGYALGTVLYLAFFQLHYGDPLAGFVAQKVFVFKNSISNLVDIPRFLSFLFRPPERFLQYTNGGLDKAMIVVSLLCLLSGMMRTRDPFVLTAWICFALLPAMMGEGGSYARHALLAWAFFVLVVGPSLKPLVKSIFIGSGFVLQTYLGFQFGGNNWVG